MSENKQGEMISKAKENDSIDPVILDSQIAQGSVSIFEGDGNQLAEFDCLSPSSEKNSNRGVSQIDIAPEEKEVKDELTSFSSDTSFSDGELSASMNEEINTDMKYIGFVSQKQFKEALVLIERRLSGLEQRMDINEQLVKIRDRMMIRQPSYTSYTSRMSLNLGNASIIPNSNRFQKYSQFFDASDRSLIEQFGSQSAFDEGNQRRCHSSSKQSKSPIGFNVPNALEDDNVNAFSRLDTIERRLDGYEITANCNIMEQMEAKFVELYSQLDGKMKQMNHKFKQRMQKLSFQESELNQKAKEMSLSFDCLRQSHFLSSEDLVSSREELLACLHLLSAQISRDEQRISQNSSNLHTHADLLNDIQTDLLEVIQRQKHFSEELGVIKNATNDIDIIKHLYFVSPHVMLPTLQIPPPQDSR